MTLDAGNRSSECSNYEITFRNVYEESEYSIGISEGENTVAGLIEESGDKRVVIDVRGGTFIYFLSFDYVGGEEADSYYSDVMFTFESTTGLTPSVSLSIDENIYLPDEITTSSNYSYATLSMSNDPYELLGNFTLTLTPVISEEPEQGQGVNADPVEFELAYLNGVPQKLEFYQYDLSSQNEFTYEFTYYYKGNSHTETGSVTFSPREAEFTSLVTNNMLYSNLGSGNSNYLFPIKYEYIDDYGFYMNSRVTVDGYVTNSVTLSHNWQFIEVDSGVNATGVKVNVKVEVYTANEEWITVVDETRKLYESTDTNVNIGGSVDESCFLDIPMMDDPILRNVNILYYQDVNNPVYSDWFIEFEDCDYTGETPDTFKYSFTPTTASIISGGSSATQNNITLSNPITTSNNSLLDLIYQGHRFNIRIYYTDSSRNNEELSYSVAQSFIINYYEQH